MRSASARLGVAFPLRAVACPTAPSKGCHGPLNPAAVSMALKDAAVREALWGKTPTALDTNHPFYRALTAITGLTRGRAGAALRPAVPSGRSRVTGRRSATSPYAPGVLAFSRILNDRGLVVVANADNASDRALRA